MDATEETNDWRGIVALVTLSTVLIAAMIAGRNHDRTRLVAGLPCAVVSEATASAILGTTVDLMPALGRECRYVSVNGAREIELVVIARPAHDGKAQAYRFIVDGPGVSAEGARRYERRIVATLARGTVAFTGPASPGTLEASAAAPTPTRTP